MEKPVIIAVDDDASVLAAVVRDLRREYGGDYRILRADSGESALEALRSLKLRGDAVALLVVDQRMPGMSGIDLLRSALELFPEAKRVLLTAYADTDAAIRAINEIRLDHYLMKPWDPPEEQLYPVLSDLLDDWRAGFRAPYDGVRVVSHRWSAEGHRLRDFLARNLVPYRWLDVELNPDATQLVEIAGLQDAPLPIVFLPDGSHLLQPANAELALRLGMRTQADSPTYDLIIIGAGPAGLAAAVYGASEGLSTLLIEREAPGGQAGQSSRIENYLGFPAGLSGSDLTRRAVAQAVRLGAEVVSSREAMAVRVRDQYRTVVLDDGAEVSGQSLLIATGVSYRLLDVPGADRLAGAGVYYGAAISEAFAARDSDVAIIGGGNSAGQAAMYLSRFARSVTMLIRGPGLAATMSDYLIRQIHGTPNIAVRVHTDVVEVHGDRSLEGVTVRERGRDATALLPVTSLFVFIGASPRTEWLGDLVARDPQGYILAGRDLAPVSGLPHWSVPREPFWLETSVPGIFVAGDVRHRSVKRIASAVGEGAMAVQFIHQHLSGAVLAPRPKIAPALVRA